MADFRLYLDGTLYQNSMDFSNLEIVYERGLQTMAMISKFSENVTMVNAGYAYLANILDTTGPCGTVDVLIESRCEGETNYQTLIEGIILLSDVERDDEHCEMNVSIESNDIFNVFLDKITDEAYITSFDDVTDFVDINGVPIVHTGKGATLYDCFTTILDRITDGALLLASDFLTTAESNGIYRYDFSATPINGEVITIVIRSEEGQLQEIQITSDGNATNFAQAVEDGVAYFASSIFSNGSDFVFPVVDTSAFVATGIIDFHTYSEGVIVAITSSGATSISGILPNPSDFVRGGRDILISTGKLLNNDTQDGIQISFQELYEKVARDIYGLTYSFEKVGNQWYLRLEPYEYFFTDSVALQCDVIGELITTYDTKKIGKKAKFSIINTGIYALEYSSKNFTGCSNFLTFNDDPKIHYTRTEINSQIDGSIDKGNELFIMHSTLSGATYNINHYGYDTFGQTTLIEYNWPIWYQPIIHYQLFMLTDAIKVADYNNILVEIGITGAGTPVVNSATADSIPVYAGTEKQLYIYKQFKTRISQSEILNLDETGEIEVTYKGETITGYIMEIRYNASTQEAEIKIIV